jgi:uncharacterized protein involved in exopolysaccharide biosynthesis
MNDIVTQTNGAIHGRLPQGQAVSGEDEISVLDMLFVLAKHKAAILKAGLAAAVIAAAVALLLPDTYTGTARILPPQQSQSSASALLSQLGGLAGMAGGGLGGLKNPNDLYVAMLQSGNIREKLAKRFGLQKVYEQPTLTDTLKKLADNSVISAGTDGVIVVAVDDGTPQLAASLANAYVEELDRLMQVYALSDASQRRLFFEQQLRQAKGRLTDAELALDRTPNTSLQYLDALRNLRYQESMYEILARQFEMAKLDEAKDYPLVQVLDRATPPEEKSMPRRGLIVALSTFVTLFLAVMWAFVREGVLRAHQVPQQAERMQALREALRWKKR